MVELVGFEEKPFSIIFWQRDGNFISKTVCYSAEEELAALNRFYDTNDFYSTYNKAVIYRDDGQFEITEKEAV